MGVLVHLDIILESLNLSLQIITFLFFNQDFLTQYNGGQLALIVLLVDFVLDAEAGQHSIITH